MGSFGQTQQVCPWASFGIHPHNLLWIIHVFFVDGSLWLFVPRCVRRSDQGLEAHASGLADLFVLTASEAMDFDLCYEQVREEAHVLARIGFDLQSFIPDVLDPMTYPKRDGKGNVVINKETGMPDPAFAGKNPSFWSEDGRPILAKPNQPCTHEEIIRRIDIARQLNVPIGIGVIPHEPYVVIDFDRKHYSSKEEMNSDLKRMVELQPRLPNTRIESTPSGGWHIYLKVKDLSEWKQAGGKWHCNFSMSEGGSHRGEILTGGNRFCAAAPSRRFDGPYQVRKPEFASIVIEIERLSEISIFPSVKRHDPLADVQVLNPSTTKQSGQHPQEIVGTVEQLRRLITQKAQRVLKGDLVYKADDRSGTLATLGNELFSWNNLAAEYGYNFFEAVESLFQEAVLALNCEDKGDRIFQTLNPGCCFDDLEWARKRIEKLLESCSTEPLALNPLQDFSRHSGGTISDEDMSVEDALNELIRLSSRDRINAKDLLPPYLQEALSVIRETIEYDWELILAVLMAGISGALPLENEIKLTPGFVQPMSIWALLLLDTGELKSPLIKFLVSIPWKTSVDVVMKKRHQDAITEWKRLKSDDGKNGIDFDIPRPGLAHTIITEDRTAQGIERHFVEHERFAKGSVLLVIDEGKDILAEMSGRVNPTALLPFGSWILSRYDGAGGRGAKADVTNERNYSQCRLAALFCCQPSVYRQITGDADQTGLAARFVVVEQNTVNQKFPTTFDPSHEERYQSLQQVLSGLYTFVCSQPRIPLELTDEARVAFQIERQSLQDRKNQTLSDSERGLINKCHGRIGRFAGIFQIIWSFNPHQPLMHLQSTKVGVEHMNRAILWNRHLLSQTVLVRQTSSGNCIAMQKILLFHNNSLKVKKPVRISQLRVTPVSQMRLTKVEAPIVADALQRLGYGRVITDEKARLCYQALKPLSA